MGRTSMLFGESSFVLRAVPPITYVVVGNKCQTQLHCIQKQISTKNKGSKYVFCPAARTQITVKTMLTWKLGFVASTNLWWNSIGMQEKVTATHPNIC